MSEENELKDLVGVTMRSVEKIGDDQLVFTAEDGKQWRLYHAQDCCEDVHIEDVAGDLDDLVGSPILRAVEASNQIPEGRFGDTQTWTFYLFSTVKGHVTVRWLGESNGYYSESVDFEAIKAKPEPAE
jgi:hypothetical protein